MHLVTVGRSRIGCYVEHCISETELRFLHILSSHDLVGQPELLDGIVLLSIALYHRYHEWVFRNRTAIRNPRKCKHDTEKTHAAP